MRRALESLRRRAPDCYGEVAGCLERAPVGYAVGEERFTVAVAGGRVTVRPGWTPSAPARVLTSPPAVLAMFDGTATLEGLLADEALVVKAGSDTLLELSSAVSLFAAEAATSPAFSRQFEEYRSWVQSRP